MSEFDRDVPVPLGAKRRYGDLRWITRMTVGDSKAVPKAARGSLLNGYSTAAIPGAWATVHHPDGR